MQGFPNGHALVVGVGAYGDEEWNVPTASRDAEDLAAALRDPAAAGYPPGNVDLLRDDQATRAGVLAALGRLADRVAEQSVALISFTCHGASGERGLYYLATHDTRFTPGGQIVEATGVSVADLVKALRAIRARRVLLLVNACFAGELSPRLTAVGVAPGRSGVGRTLADAEGNELVNSGEGRAILTAARPDQSSYIVKSAPHSFFGEAVLAVLRNGVGEGRAVGLFELYESVYRDVQGAARRLANATQEPSLTLLQGVGPFPVAASRGQAGDGPVSQQRPQAGVVREAPVINLNVTNKSSVISFDGAQIMGNVRTGHVVQGDLTVIGGEPRQQDDDEPEDPRRRLALLSARVAVARNVDEDARDDAVNKLNQAERALGNGDSARARLRLDQALAILRAMNNGYVNSAVRKLEELARGL